MAFHKLDDYKDQLSFLAEWFDTEVAYTKNFLFCYYPCDNTIALFDLDLDRVFLKRSTCEGITSKDIFVGNTVRIYGRQIHITQYADEHTRNFIGTSKEHTFLMLKPGVINRLGEVIADIEKRDFMIVRMRMCRLSRKAALRFYEFRKGNPFLPFILEHVISGPVVALEVVGEDAMARLLKELGPVDPIVARKTHPSSLRALYGHERASNGFHSSEDVKEAQNDACYFFPQGIDRKPPEITLQLKNSTCCVIKPHAIHEGKMGYILKDINESQFYITALQMFYLNKANADEFLEVYKGVVSNFNALLLSFLDGPCVAMEISSHNPDIDVHAEFRKFAGPSDSDIARQIRPNTLRAKFGVDKYKNAVHCTDLPEDTVLELEYFFKILDV